MMDSTTLRLWILLLGLVVVGVIYGWGAWQEGLRRRKRRVEPALGSMVETNDWAVIPEIPPQEPWMVHEDNPSYGKRRVRAAQAPVPPPVKDLILTLSLVAPRGRVFNGADLRKSFDKAGLVYGDMRIYHAPVDFERPDGPALFSVANILEPGTLEPDRLKFLTTPGLMIFARLPAPVLGIEVFEHMQATGRFLAKELGGELCDESRQPYTPEKADEIIKRIMSEIGNIIRNPEF
jgi:cell division protein ZipA